MPDHSKNPRYYGNNKVKPSNKKNEDEISNNNENSTLETCCMGIIMVLTFLAFIIWFFSPYI